MNCVDGEVPTCAVEPVLGSTVLSGQPVLTSRLSKTRIRCLQITVIFTSMKRSTTFNGHGHL